MMWFMALMSLVRLPYHTPCIVHLLAMVCYHRTFCNALGRNCDRKALLYLIDRDELRINGLAVWLICFLKGQSTKPDVSDFGKCWRIKPHNGFLFFFLHWTDF